jgi:tetratricopeptide (TPR) repeat protein
LIVGLVVVLCWIASASIARADADPKAAARDQFQRGVAAFDERRFAEAAEHFEAAYRLSPAYVVLYNIGQVQVILGRSVEAVDAFDKYLKQGASSVSPERRQEVQAEIEKQLARIGTIAVRTTPDGADVRVDGVAAGKSPLARPVRVTAGRHVVAASLAGHAPVVREVDVTGRAELALELVLEAKDAPRAATAPPEPPPLPPPAPAPVVEMPIVEKTIIERTYVETPSSNRPAAAVEQRAHGQSTAAIVQRIIAGGLATATTGGIIAYRGSNESDKARDRLAVPGLSDAEWDAALADFNAGKDRNQQGWIIAGIGAAVLVGGIIVVATVPERSSYVSLAPWTTAGAGGLTMNGRF